MKVPTPHTHTYPLARADLTNTVTLVSLVEAYVNQQQQINKDLSPCLVHKILITGNTVQATERHTDIEQGHLKPMKNWKHLKL